MQKSGVICLMVLVLLSGIFCAKPNQPEEQSEFVKLPMPDEEAELMALYLSGEILAPLALYERIQRELRTIREDSSAEHAGRLDMRYWPRFGRASYLYFGIDEPTYRQIISGNYHAWDALHDLYRMTDFIAYKPSYGYNYCTEIYFEGRRNPEVLARAYGQLPGFLEYRETSFIGGHSNIYPRTSADTVSYLFHGCTVFFPFGCDIDEFWYFVGTADNISYVGNWLPERGNIEYPEWWAEAGKNWFDSWQRPFKEGPPDE